MSETVKSVVVDMLPPTFVDEPIAKSVEGVPMVVVAAKIESNAHGEVVPMPTLPWLVTMKLVAVLEPMTKDGEVPLVAVGLMESCPQGEEDPIPSVPQKVEAARVPVVLEPTIIRSKAEVEEAMREMGEPLSHSAVVVELAREP